MQRGLAAAIGLMACGLLPGRAEADGYPPYYGYSPYFGAPAVYFTPETDVRVATTQDRRFSGVDIRTYYYGGPFYGYRPTVVRRAYYPRRGRRHAVLRRRG